jgi:hypothetical protein
VELVVAGSNPVGHPIFISAQPKRGFNERQFCFLIHHQRNQAVQEQANQPNRQEGVNLAPLQIGQQAWK